MCSLCLLSFGATCLFNIIGYYQINKKLNEIKQQKPLVMVSPPSQTPVQYQDKVGYFTDDKFDNIHWIPKEEYYKNSNLKSI